MHLLATFPGWWFWDPTGKWYVFWSGIGSNLGYLVFFGAIWRYTTCDTEGCHRIGLYKLEGRSEEGALRVYRLCSRHHPHKREKQTREVIFAAIEKAKGVLKSDGD